MLVLVLVLVLVLERKHKKQKQWVAEREQLFLDLYLQPEGQLKIHKLPPE